MPESGGSDIVLVYFIGSVGMLLLAGAIFFFFITYQKRLLKKELEINKIKADQQREILNNTIEAQEKERKRIAQDLHDEVGAMLSVVKLNVNRLEKKINEEVALSVARETKSYLDETITQVRRIIRDLLPVSLSKLGIYPALEELAKRINRTEQIKVECWFSGEQQRFEKKQELAMFRVIQELINNALKHSEADLIEVKMKFTSAGLCFTVFDNGIGFDVELKRNEGLGLKNLESRTQILGARYKLKSNPGRGTTAIFSIWPGFKN